MKRNPDGTFAPGNEGGPGNPYAARVNAVRGALLECVSPEDVADVARALLEKAKAGDVAAAKVLLDRLLGKPRHTVDVAAARRLVLSFRQVDGPEAGAGGGPDDD